MQVDIWSDVRCPFCYIGKHKFEQALERFPHKDEINVVWHSFELDPGLETDPGVDALDHLAGIKGIGREQAEEMTRYVAQAAAEAGLELDSGKAVVANSLNAHRLIQYAKTKGLATAVEEQLFRAHFTAGKNIDDKDVLAQAGVAAGLEAKALGEVLASGAFTEAVRQDELAARSIGISGVPFFVFNNRYAVSGAQSPDLFLQTLQRSWKEFKESKGLVITEGESCSVDGCQ